MAELILRPEKYNDKPEKRIDSPVEGRFTQRVVRGFEFCQQVNINDSRWINSAEAGTTVWFAAAISLPDDPHRLDGIRNA